MSDTPARSELSLPLAAACELSVECWRLRRLSEVTSDATARVALSRTVRHLTEILEQLDIEVVDLTGRAYDAGMVQEVIEVRQDTDLSAGSSIVQETVQPTIICRGHVVREGQIILRSFGAGSPGSNEERE